MAIFEIRSDIKALENDVSLYKEQNFSKRADAIDFIEFHVLEQIECLLSPDHHEELTLLNLRAQKLKSGLEQIDVNLFYRLRDDICQGKDFKTLVREYIPLNLDSKHHEEAGYDNLDVFSNGLLTCQSIPGQTKTLEPDMVYYQKTPARIVFELVEKTQFTERDVFVDIGSGLGQVAILVNLLTGITCKGIEFEPAFCDYARDCAAALNLPGVTFINTDARRADYCDGTIFFMYTPFSGEMLQEVLELLWKESLQRKITIITYGPCTTQVADQKWLDTTGFKNADIYKLYVFKSL